MSSTVPGSGTTRRWWLALAGITLAGLAIRLLYLAVWMHPAQVQGDPFYYHHAANLFADGRGWPDPYDLLFMGNSGTYVPDAQHPPLMSMLLAIPSLFGLTSFLAHQVFSCMLGAAAVAVVGLAARRAAGGLTGLVAAGIAAAYPGMWLNDALVMSETAAILTCSLLLLAAYRFWDRRRAADAAWMGTALGAAMLARAELALLAVSCVVPLVLLARDASWRRRLGFVAVAGATSAVLVSPWAAYNLARFSEPEFISSGLGSTLAVTHCPATYSGPFTGWWSYDCIQQLERAGNVPDERSERDVYYREQAYAFIADHGSEIPRVALARLGRTWGLYHPWQQVQLDTIELRPQSLSRAGMVSLWVLEVAAVAGIVLLRRRRVVVLPLLSVPVALSVATVMVYGTTRFRAAAEPSVVVLAAVALAAAGVALHGRLRGAAPALAGAAPMGPDESAPAESVPAESGPAGAGPAGARSAGAGPPAERPAGTDAASVSVASVSVASVTSAGTEPAAGAERAAGEPAVSGIPAGP